MYTYNKIFIILYLLIHQNLWVVKLNHPSRTAANATAGFEDTQLNGGQSLFELNGLVVLDEHPHLTPFAFIVAYQKIPHISQQNLLV